MTDKNRKGKEIDIPSCTPGNCPFATGDMGEGWGFSPEGWEVARKIHEKYHIKSNLCNQ